MNKITVVLFVSFLLISCRMKKDEKQVTKEVSKFYTCSMHPQIMQLRPGNCPICGMKLIEVNKSTSLEKGEIKLSDEQIKLSNLFVDTIKNNVVGDHLFLTATLNFDQNKTYAISSKVAGRIERLYYKSVGDYIKKGDKLFDIYSEELNNAKQEYVSAIERKKTLGNSVIDFSRLIKSAKTKLQLWGMSDAQIESLDTHSSAVTTFYSNYSGSLTSLEIKEGDYVMDGAALLKLADLSTLWAEVQVYSSQLSQIDRQGTALIKFPDIPDKIMSGKIDFVNPEINADTRINLIRINVSNQLNNLKPGMPAIVELKSRNYMGLTLPIDAVLRNEKGAIVWIQTSLNTFKSRAVKLGFETDDNRVEIKEGLSEGDRVVVNGAYLLNSEYIFKNGTEAN